MKNSFFSRFKQSLGSDYGGRYYAAVMTECINSDPSLAEAIFGWKFKESFKATVEWSFPGVSTNRRADIAILEESSQILLGLIEIKYEDELLDGIDKQLDDYLRIVKQEGIAFAYVTIYSPKPEHIEKLNALGGRHIYFSDIYNAICRKRSPIARMFAEFLREEMPVFEDMKNHDKALELLLVKGLGLTSASRIQSNECTKRFQISYGYC